MESDPTAADCLRFADAANRPLIGILSEENGRQVVRYSTDDPASDPQREADAALRAALSVVGAWSDIDWEDFAAELDRIRHESHPTPPIEL